MENNQPLVSVIMNCYNSDKYLREAIDSVLEQTYQNWEIIFWDNQSTDRSAEIVKSYDDERIKYFYAHEHTLLGEARNLAVKKANGEYIAFLDCDDLWKNQKLALQINLMVKNPNIGLCHSNYMIYDMKNNKLSTINKSKSIINKENIVQKYNIGMLTVVIKTNFLKLLEENIFDSKLKLIEEYDLFCRIVKQSDIVYCHQNLATYRWHSENSSNKYISEWSKEYKYLSEKYKLLNFSKNEIDYLVNMSIFTNIKSLMLLGKYSDAKNSNEEFNPLSTKQYILKILLLMPIFIIKIFKPLWKKWTRF